MEKRLNVECLSASYMVRELGEQEIDAIFALCLGNPQFYQYCPPAVSRESIRQDQLALPQGKEYKDKYYIGFYSGDRLAAIMDLILGYPNPETAFIGFFMVDRQQQGSGVGSAIVGQCFDALKARGFSYIRLAYVRGNRQSESFWRKNGFAPTGVEIPLEAYTEVILQKSLL